VKELKFTKTSSLSTKSKKEQKKRFYQSVSIVSQLGLSIALPPVAGAFLGKFLDEKFQLAPIMTLSFIFLGLIISLTSFYTTIKKLK